MAWRETMFWLAGRVAVIAVALGLAVSTVRAAPMTPPCDCGKKGACCEQSAKSGCQKHDSQNKDQKQQCPEKCKAICCSVVALPGTGSEGVAGTQLAVAVVEIDPGMRGVCAGDVILPPPRA
jgi:hypothetical protein